MRNTPIVALASLIAACAPKPPLLVQAKGDGTTCMVRANGDMLPSAALDDTRLRALAKSHGGRVVVDTDPDTPYKCIGGSVFNLQNAGFRDVSVRVNGVDLPRK